ncbi:MAG: GTP 3',8-cyclase MoaA [Caulobacterales bacterium]|jgi:cyclic pyranopterin phosphate synthase
MSVAPTFDAAAAAPVLIDPFGRAISYLRVSVTDRCDLRCTYCMAEQMSFLPKSDLLSFEELDRLCSAFIAKGVRKLRLTGGEPLVRKDVMALIESLSRKLGLGLEELTLTTNGTQLAKHAGRLADLGVRRINVSLDTLDRATFARIARRDLLPAVLEGIDAADRAGLQVKINTVALAKDNAGEIPALIQWAHRRGFDMTLIETMPMGEVEGDRIDQFLSLKQVERDLQSFWTLDALPDRTGGPARYVRIVETGGRLGFITPLTHNFCESCNRVRLTCTGTLYMCLGQDAAADLRSVVRSGADDAVLGAAIDEAISRKPKGHDFMVDRLGRPSVARHMSVTGG